MVCHIGSQALRVDVSNWCLHITCELSHSTCMCSFLFLVYVLGSLDISLFSLVKVPVTSVDTRQEQPDRQEGGLRLLSLMFHVHILTMIMQRSQISPVFTFHLRSQ